MKLILLFTYTPAQYLIHSRYIANLLPKMQEAGLIVSVSVRDVLVS